jgi:hypothetical protein
MNKKLKPCPFCGVKPGKRNLKDYPYTMRRIKHKETCFLYAIWEASLIDICSEVEKWNRRDGKEPEE